MQALVCAAINQIEGILDINNQESLPLSRNMLPINSSPILIVSPASLTFHWVDEINKFFNASNSPDFPCLLLPVLCNSEFFNNVQHDKFQARNVFIVSYDFLRRQSAFFLSKRWELIILDEAHLIRNPNNKMTKTIFSLNAKYRLALTGTPLQNRLDDVWSIMNFILPDYLGKPKL